MKWGMTFRSNLPTRLPALEGVSGAASSSPFGGGSSNNNFFLLLLFIKKKKEKNCPEHFA